MGLTQPVDASDRPRSPVLVMRDITKEFASGRVLHGVDFDAMEGEVHALVGQNGAGKSTLMKVLGGVFVTYGGSVEIGGQPVRLTDPRQAFEAGVAVIYQELDLVPHLTVAENIMLGREPLGALPVYSRRRVRMGAVAVLRDVGFDLPLDEQASHIGVARQQLTVIAKAIARRARILVMDEPTARLSGPERDQLFGIIRQLRERGVAIVYISHFLEEVFAVAQRVTVIRDGRVVAVRRTDELDQVGLASLMLGSAFNVATQTERSREEGPVVLEVDSMSAPPFLRQISFTLRRGEVLGLAGLVGSGRTRLARLLAGADRWSEGVVRVSGRLVRPRDPGQAAQVGILLLPEDRKVQGLVLRRTVGENVVLTALQTGLSRLGFVRLGARNALIQRMLRELSVQPADPQRAVATLSGGNQQKVAIARTLAAKAKVLILDQPTAGVDISTKHQLYRLIDNLAQDGLAVVVISDDLDELVALSDRILVMQRGQIVSELGRAEMDRNRLLELVLHKAA